MIAKRLLPFPLFLFLAACGSPYPYRQPPAPVESAGSVVTPPSTATATEEGAAEVHAYRPPTRVARARRPASPAVRRLLRQAAQQRRAGNFAAAQASLERALRIEPRNPRLWNRLAHLYAAQRQYARVEAFAAKSNALAGDDAVLRADNWALIAEARAALGDRRGAAEARRKARIIQ